MTTANQPEPPLAETVEKTVETVARAAVEVPVAVVAGTVVGAVQGVEATTRRAVDALDDLFFGF